MGTFWFLSFAYSIVSIVLGAVNFYADLSYGMGMLIACFVIVCLYAVFNIIVSFSFMSIGRIYIFLGLICLAFSVLPVVYGIQWFIEGSYAGADLLVGGISVLLYTGLSVFGSFKLASHN